MQTHTPLVTNLIKGQLNTCNILDERVLYAFDATPRERFLPPQYQNVAYVDRLISLGEYGALQEPLVTARMLDVAAIAPHETVFVLGDATGYTSVLVSYLAAHVATISLSRQEYPHTLHAIEALERDNITVCHSEQEKTCDDSFKADVLIIDGGVQTGLENTLHFLRAGGRIVTVMLDSVRPGGHIGQGILTLFTEHQGYLDATQHGEATVQLLPSFAKAQAFSL